MTEQRTGPSRRTQADRDAINARAAAWERPLSARQRRALGVMPYEPLQYKHATERWASRWGVYSDATIHALERRGLCRIEGKQRPKACITAAGRKALGGLR